MTIADKLVYFTVGASIVLFAWTMVRVRRTLLAPKLAPPPAGQTFVSLRLVPKKDTPLNVWVRRLWVALILLACVLWYVSMPPNSCEQTFPPFVDTFWWVIIFLPSMMFAVPVLNHIMLPRMAWHFHHGYDKNPHRTAPIKRMPTHEYMWPFSGVFLHPMRAYYHPKVMKYFAVAVALLLVAFEVYWLLNATQLLHTLFAFDSLSELNQLFIEACIERNSH